MRLKLPKQNLPFAIAYFVSLLILLLNQINALPMASILRKVKYAYVLFVAILIVANPVIKKGIKAALFVMFLYIAHSALFGTVFVNYLVPYEIQDNVSQMIWFLLFVLVTFIYVAQHNYFKGFIVLSYYATGLQLLIGGLMHHSEFSNPVWGLVQAFTADVRYKGSFGFVHAGYTSNACFLVLVLSVFYFEIYRKTELKNNIWFWVTIAVIDGVAALEIIAAAERSGIICTFMVFSTYLFFVFFRIRIEQKTLFFFLLMMCVAIVLFVVTGGLASVWGDSNRELNITVNYPLFQAYANPLFGLGFIENAGYHADRNLYPMPTSSLDMYYVYIFFATGYVGIFMIGLALITILIKLLINKRTDFNIIGIWFYLTMLFFAVWQANLFTHRYISSYVISVLLLCSMSNDFCMGADECTNIKSTESTLNQI